MTIDKSIRQHYDVPGTKKIKGQLHKLAYITEKEIKALKKMGGIETRTPEGILAYPPPGERGGPGSGAEGRAPSGGGEGGRSPGDHHPPSRPVSRPAPVVTTAVAPPSILSREVKPAHLADTGGSLSIITRVEEPRHHSIDTPIQIKEQKILDEIREKEKEQFDADWGFEDKKGLEPTVPPKKYKDVVVHHPEVDDVVPTKIRDYYSPTGYQDLSRDLSDTGETWGERAEAGIKRGSGILGTMGKIALTGLTAGAGAGLFGKDIATIAKLANYKKNYDRIQKSTIGKKLGLKELDISNLKSTIDKVADLRSRPSDMPEHLGERGFRTRDDTPPRDGDGIQTAVTGEDVISESIKKYISLNDDQVNYIRAQLKGRDPEELRGILAQAKSRIESGEANQMEKDVFALVQEYLVDPTQYIAHGGRIDGPLMGGSRYI
jgi:hypothetical protein